MQSLEEKSELKLRINKIENDLVLGNIIRSRVEYVQCNENPSNYFCNLENERGNEKTIHSFVNENITYNTSELILEQVRTFYQSLYTAEPVDSSLNDLFRNNMPQVSSDDNAFIDQVTGKSEILST